MIENCLPGESAEVTIAADLPQHGDKQVLVRIATRGAGDVEHLIPINLHGVPLNPPYIKEMPREIEITGTVAKEQLERVFYVTTVEEAHSVPWLSGFSAGSEAISVAVVAQPQPTGIGSAIQRKYECRLAAAIPRKSTGRQTFRLSPQVRTRAAKPLRAMTVQVRNEPSLRLVPETVYFGESEAKQPAERTVLLVHRAGTAFEVSLDGPTVDWVTADLMATEVPSTKRVTLRLNPDVAVEDVNIAGAQLILKTSVEGCERLTLPIMLASGNR